MPQKLSRSQESTQPPTLTMTPTMTPTTTEPKTMSLPGRGGEHNSGYHILFIVQYFLYGTNLIFSWSINNILFNLSVCAHGISRDYFAYSFRPNCRFTARTRCTDWRNIPVRNFVKESVTLFIKNYLFGNIFRVLARYKLPFNLNSKYNLYINFRVPAAAVGKHASTWVSHHNPTVEEDFITCPLGLQLHTV